MIKVRVRLLKMYEFGEQNPKRTLNKDGIANLVVIREWNSWAFTRAAFCFKRTPGPDELREKPTKRSLYSNFSTLSKLFLPNLQICTPQYDLNSRINLWSAKKNYRCYYCCYCYYLYSCHLQEEMQRILWFWAIGANFISNFVLLLHLAFVI